MTTTTHHAICTCCGTGKLTVTIDDGGPHWGDCQDCGKSPLSMSPETHAALMAEHERAKELGDA